MVKIRDLALITGCVGVGLFTYGVFVEARRPVLERRTLRLPHWPERLDGMKIAVLADLHVHNLPSVELAKQAVAMALDCTPDIVILPGDLVDNWTLDVPRRIGEVLEPLLMMEGNVIATPGNRDYRRGDAGLLKPILDELNIKFLRNESWEHAGVTWVGLDSARAGNVDMVRGFRDVESEPVVVIWHEPDLVGTLPRRCSLQISGHSHGGQFILPFGFTPMHTELGSRYVRGFFEDTPTPLYVSRGVGTTLLPSRLNCRPEVSLLTLVS